ncbi:RICIN domain-containing protein [Massilia sp. PAMC28688]|uniref:RICIN domain-containing protein n=1 Tax=Massilia sp. PAMC28688 TaxID=2861283 RepID=UPI001C634514|nr:RICIN domain-containing protein [Massilia sp. PAMC28688]QYF93857.1 RICIN domain-containing protein [Massilia sp. PAMC28688]
MKNTLFAGKLLPLAAAGLLAACADNPQDHTAIAARASKTAAVLVQGTAADSLAPGRYVIVNAQSGKCVDVAWASMADGGNIQQVDCNTNLAQVFDVSQPAAGVYKLTNAGSGKVMDVSASSTLDGANVQQWTDNGTNAQRFTVARTLGNRYVLTNVNSKKCVDVAGGSLASGANIQQATCNNTAAQQFHFYPRSDAGRGVLPVGLYALSSHHSRLCLGIDGASINAGARAVQATCAATSAQRFHVLAGGNGSYWFANANSGLALEIAGGSTANGAQVIQRGDAQQPNQRFSVNATSSGYQIVARNSNRCLDVPGWSTTAGAVIQQWDCGNQANQRWAFEPVTGATVEPPPTGGWRLVWADEFNGTSVDMNKWEFEVNGAGGGNGELQYYTARPENAFVSNGALTIRAQRENYCSTDGCRQYTSARLRTRGKGDWLYGRMEARARLPRGQGLWPAIWMLPTDFAYGGWAASGEIDIVEAVNLGGAGGNSIFGTLHYGGAWPNNVHKGGNTAPAASVVDNFHTYAVEWEPTQIRFYLNGVLYHTATDWWSSGGAFPAPFDKRFHMLLNVAVGGNWPGSPDAGTVFPQTMQVDYVRVYQK